MKKRSVTIAGHRTSLTLEDAFWIELQTLAKSRKISLNQMITDIDGTRDLSVNLSSALRLFVLADLQNKVAKNKSAL